MVRRAPAASMGAMRDADREDSPVEGVASTAVEVVLGSVVKAGTVPRFSAATVGTAGAADVNLFTTATAATATNATPDVMASRRTRTPTRVIRLGWRGSTGIGQAEFRRPEAVLPTTTRPRPAQTNVAGSTHWLASPERAELTLTCPAGTAVGTDAGRPALVGVGAGLRVNTLNTVEAPSPGADFGPEDATMEATDPNFTPRLDPLKV